jgi:hypothetical protein
MNPLVTLQLTETFDREQTTFEAKPPKPPKGWKKFTVKYREAMLITSLDDIAHAIYVPVCPTCDSPRFYMDPFGWIWLKEKGFSESDYVCACVICGCRVFGLKPKRLKACHYEPVPQFRRHPEDEGEGGPYVDEEIALASETGHLHQQTQYPEVKMVTAGIPLCPKEAKHAKSRRHKKA